MIWVGMFQDWLRDLAFLLAIPLTGLVLLAGLIVGYFPLAKYLPVVGDYVKVAKFAAFLAFGLLCTQVTAKVLLDRCSEQMEADREAAKAAALERDKSIADELGRKYGPEIARLNKLNLTLQKRARDHANTKPVQPSCRLGDAAGWVRTQTARSSGAAAGRSAGDLRTDPRAR